MTRTMQPVPATSVSFVCKKTASVVWGARESSDMGVWKDAYAFVPAEEDCAVDAFTLAAEFEALVEELHECIALVDRNRLDRGSNLGRLGAIHDLK